MQTAHPSVLLSYLSPFLLQWQITNSHEHFSPKKGEMRISRAMTEVLTSAAKVAKVVSSDVVMSRTGSWWRQIYMKRDEERWGGGCNEAAPVTSLQCLYTRGNGAHRSSVDSWTSRGNSQHSGWIRNQERSTCWITPVQTLLFSLSLILLHSLHSFSPSLIFNLMDLGQA